jgi:hypothetical protein
MEKALRDRGMMVFRGGDFDRWDLQLRRGIFASTRLIIAIEEHGNGHQLAKVKFWPRFAAGGTWIALIVAGLAISAISERNVVAGLALTGVFLAFCIRTLQECSTTMDAVLKTLQAAVPVVSKAPEPEAKPVITEKKDSPLNGVFADPHAPRLVPREGRRGSSMASPVGPA